MHARLKNEFTEDEKYHTLMSWLIVLTGLGVLEVHVFEHFIHKC